MIQGAFGWKGAGQATETELPAGSDVIRAGAIDADFLIVGHPSRALASEFKRCEMHFIAVSGHPVNALIAGAPVSERGVSGEFFVDKARTPRVSEAMPSR